MAGVQTPNLPATALLTEVVGNALVGGRKTTTRATLSTLAQLLLATGPLADAVTGQTSGVVIFTAVEEMADVAYADRTGAWLVAGATSGVYRKDGASGTGAWVWVCPLPFSFVVATDTGSGTPNAILAAPTFPVSSAALIIIDGLVAANTSTSPTISFDDGVTTYAIKTNSGSAPAVGGLSPSSMIMGRIVGPNFVLVTDEASSAVLAQAEAILAAIGSVIPLTTDSVGMWAFRKALLSAGSYEAVRTHMPARSSDEHFAATIAWETSPIVTPGDAFSSWLQVANPDGPGLTAAAVAALFTSARSKVL